MENENDGGGWGYLISAGEDQPANPMFYKMGQIPTNWIRKGMQHRRDAMIIYSEHFKMKKKIIERLEEKKFRFDYFFRHDLTGMVGEILEENPSIFLPDFDAYYNLMHLSVENFLKGIWLDSNRQMLGFDELPRTISSHSLVNLMNDCGMKMTKDMRKLFSKSYENFMSYFRYPIKLKVKPEVGTKGLDFGDRSFESVCFEIIGDQYELDEEQFMIFLKRIDPNILKIMKSEGDYIELIFK